MISCKTRVLVQCIVLWNACVETYHKVTFRISDFLYYMRDYYYGYHDTWLFVSEHSAPISLNHFYNVNNISWIYNNYSTTLNYTDSSVNKQFYTLSWLSAKVRIRHATDKEDSIEYDIDDFLEKFIVTTSPDFPPSLRTIFNAWCAHTKHWFHPNRIIDFCIIDDKGEDHAFNVSHDHMTVVLKNTKIYVSKQGIH